MVHPPNVSSTILPCPDVAHAPIGATGRRVQKEPSGQSSQLIGVVPIPRTELVMESN